MLESPASLDTLYQIVYSPRDFAKEHSEFGGLPVFEFPKLDTARETRHKKAKEALHRLAGSLCFLVENPDDSSTEDCCAMATPSFAVQPYGINIADNSPAPAGIGSLIRINESHLVKLGQLLMHKDDNQAQIFSLQFRIATSICHDIAHAVGHAANIGLLLESIIESTYDELAVLTKVQRRKKPVRFNEPFFEQDPVAELGYLWEQTVLGGTIQWASEVSHPLFFGDWPSFLTDSNNPRRAGFKRTATQYVVPMHYLRNLHRQEFWDAISADDTTALRIKKVVGIKVTNIDADNDPLGFPCAQDGTEDSSPTDGSDSFRVCKDGKGRDPSRAKANESPAARVRRVFS